MRCRDQADLPDQETKADISYPVSALLPPHYGPQIGHSLAAYMDFESFNFAISSHARVIRMWFCEMLALGFQQNRMNCLQPK